MSTSTPTKSVTPATEFTSFLVTEFDEELAHAVPAEQPLGERGADEEQRELVGEEGGHRDERRAQPVLDERARPAQPLGARGAQEVAAEHVEHGVALVAAVERHGNHDEDERGQHQVRQPVQHAGHGPRVEPGRHLAGGVEESPVKPSRLLMPMPAFLKRTPSTTAGMDSVTNEKTVSRRSESWYCFTAP